WLGLSIALALATKATAYLFLAPLVAAFFLLRPLRLRAAAIAAACVLLINGPQYWRNMKLSGSPLGYDSAHGDGQFRWRNEDLGLKPLASNVLRNASEQLGGRSDRWNQAIYQSVVGLHKRLE